MQKLHGMVNKYLILTITLSLILGFLYYYFLRDTVVGLSWLGVEKVITLDFKLATYFLWFPTFIHPFLFSILSWWAMGFTYPKPSILFWLVINLLAEIGQGMEQSFFDNFPLVLKHYFQYGVFDWFDMVSIFLGAFLAYVFILQFKKGLV